MSHSGALTKHWHCLAGGLAEDMRTASTGLMDLHEAAGPMGTAPMRIPMVPEVRPPRPTLCHLFPVFKKHIQSAGLVQP